MKRTSRAGVPAYTYQKYKTEEKTVYKRLAIIFGLMLVLVLAIWFWGLTFVQILGSLGSSDSSERTSAGLSIPAQKPTFTDLPEFTNKDTLTIQGFSSSDVETVLYVNGEKAGTTKTDSSGRFTFVDVKLKDGLNLLKVTATDTDGKGAEERVPITVDKTPPNLVVSDPKDGQNFPAGVRQITIKGTSETESTILINEIQAPTDQSGTFSYNMNASSGENKVTIKATDRAGNETNLALTFFIPN